MTIRGANQQAFAHTPNVKVQRSLFRRDFNHKTTFNASWLIPVFFDEVLPGDTFNVKMTAFARLATPIVPIMDNLYMDTFFFFVPNRLVWENWEAFCAQTPGQDAYLVPQTGLTDLEWSNSSFGALYRHFGIPRPGEPPAVPLAFNSLFFRAYNLIWNEWFRDQNLLDPVVVKTDDTDDDPALYTLLSRGKRHDYFTSALPWPQKGEAQSIAVAGGTYPVSITNNGDYFKLYPETSGPTNDRYVVFGSPTGLEYELKPPALSGDPAFYKSGLAGSVTIAGSTLTIPALRVAFQLQRMQERDARGGGRYTEVLYSHFGVISPDARLQRPEYLGGGSSPIVISPIAQTAATESGQTPLATLSAIGYVHAQHGFIKSFVEHGMVIGLVSVRADLTYQQGLERMWSRRIREDFYWPSLAHLGEQVILNQEIYAATTELNRAKVFGYQERYAEYRYKPSLVTGEFVSDGTSGGLDVWHLAQYFGSLPELNGNFIEENPPMTRIKAVSSAPDFLFDSYFNMKCVRPMPTYSIPGYVDHF